MSTNHYLRRGEADLEKEIEKKQKRREKKKRPQFKVSGKGVFKLKDLMDRQK